MKRGIVGSIVVAGVMLAAVLLALVRGGPASVSAGAVLRDAQMVTPTIVSVSPRQAPNNLDTTLVITGAGFQAVLSGTQGILPSVRLGDAELPHVGWVSLTLLTATVPWGEDPGVYTLTVVNPEGGIGRLSRAFTVERAIEVWTTGGPYGGSVWDLAVSPATSQTAFAAVLGAGLFRTHDGGAWWEMVVQDPAASGITYGPADRLLAWGGSGLRRSESEGDDWEVLVSGEPIAACAPDPQDESRVWIGSDHGVWLLTMSTDGAVERERRDGGLPSNVGVTRLVVDPVSSAVVYSGLRDGRVFKTVNAGVDWDEVSYGLGPADALHGAQAMAVHPYDPQVLLYSRAVADAPVYRSTNGGATWAVVDVAPEENDEVTDLVFSPYVSGTVYASLKGESLMVVSEDAGRTWSPLGTRDGDWMLSLGLDPSSGLPAYLGGGASGTYRSEDGGETWTLATQGVSGLLVEDIAAAQSRPETVRVASEHAGAFASEDAGRSWRQLPLSFPAAFAVAVDPVDPDVAYVGSVRDVYRMDDGETWERVSMPVTYHTHIDALAVSPLSTTVVYAGGRNDDAFQLDQDVGILFCSEDRGESWTLIDVGYPISIVSDIAVAPTATGTIYVATHGWASGGTNGAGLGVLRSEDGGGTWEVVVDGMGTISVKSLAIHPEDGRTIYAAPEMVDAGDPVVFKSEDGGDTWAPTTLEPEWGGVADLVIDPLEPETVFAGADAGLYRSVDGGASWTRAAGVLGYVNIERLAIAATDGRTILYVGTIGGVAPVGGSAHHVGRMARMDEAYVDAGVYQQTIDHRPPVGVVYLPLALRSR